MSSAAPSPKPGITLIAAVARNSVIGLNNAMPWRLPEDLQHFKALTLGHPIVMGRKTWESLGRPLPGRTNIVVTRNPAFAPAGALPAASVEDALRIAATAGAASTDEIFVIGGGEIYRQALPLANRMQLTEIDREFAGDAYFPAWDAHDWQETQRERHSAAAGFDYAFVTYARVLPSP